MCNPWFGIWYDFSGQMGGGVHEIIFTLPFITQMFSNTEIRKKKVKRDVCCLMKNTRRNAHLLDFSSLHGGGECCRS